MEKRPEDRLYRVKDVERLTGLSRRQLFEYKEAVPPFATEYAGSYKLYDEEGLRRLETVAMLKRLGFEKPEILLWLKDPALRFALASQVLDRAERQRQVYGERICGLKKLLGELGA